MKNSIIAIALCVTASMLTTGCIVTNPGGEGGRWEIEETENNSNNENNTPQEAPALDAVFVAGHLGNYVDCPEDGYTERSAARSAPAGEAADGAFAPCEDADAEYCGGPLNCEAAQLTIRVTNDGDAAASGLSVETIALLGEDGQVAATLPLIDAVDVNTGESFDGELAVGEEVTLRVDYQGPQDISEFIPSQNRWSGSAILEITLGADNHEDVEVKTKAVAVMPTIVT